MYQKVMSLWHQLHVNMKSVVSWHYLLKDIRTVSGWNLDTVRHSLILLFFCFFSTLFCLSVTCRTDPLPPCLTCQVRSQSPAERQQVLGHLESQLADFLSDSKESSLFTPGERRDLEKDFQQAQQHCQDLLLNMETGETGWTNTHLLNICFYYYQWSMCN